MVFAIAGGAALLISMLTIPFFTSPNVRLTVIYITVLLFSGLMATTNAPSNNIVAATAAYAAVMIVYIGRTSPNPHHKVS